jgi:HK97 family phage portal protein
MGDLKSVISRAWQAVAGPFTSNAMTRVTNASPVGTGGGGAPINTLPGVVGLNTDVNRALQSAAVWACCRLIANSIASLPSAVLKETEAGKVKAFDNPLYSILTKSPNTMMSASQWMQPTMMSLLLWGNAFTWIDRIDGEIVGLWPLNPARVQIVLLFDGTLGYYYSDLRGRAHAFTPADVIHFRLFTLDGYIGLPVIEYHRGAFDFEAATTAYASSIYQNGGQPGGVLEYPGELKEDQVKRIRESWQAIHSGPLNAGRVAILEDGMKYTPLSIPLSDLNYIDEKKFSVEQIARIFGVPPHLIGAMDKPTYASVEQQSIEFVRYTINPYVVSLEQSINKALLEQPYFYKMNINGFERSDIASRYRSYATARQWGWMSANDIRTLEDQNLIDGGDAYLTPLNMVSAADMTEPIPPPLAAP